MEASPLGFYGPSPVAQTVEEQEEGGRELGDWLFATLAGCVVVGIIVWAILWLSW